MITLRTSPFDLLDRLEQQVSQAERVPAAEVIETEASYTVRLELPGVDHDSIDVKATDRSLVISAERKPTIPVEVLKHIYYDTYKKNSRQQLVTIYD
jgi:HSP20 family protein